MYQAHNSSNVDKKRHVSILRHLGKTYHFRLFNFADVVQVAE